MPARIEIYGVRHHGPGSARQLVTALDEQQPDCVLVEGPPEGDDLARFAVEPTMKPPVALLAYRVDKPAHSSFWPFAEFSPEWQALQYAVGRGIAFRFIDLPATHALADQVPETAAPPEAAEGTDSEFTVEAQPTEIEVAEEAASADDIGQRIRRDPIGVLASAAGYDDGERWWEHLIEHRGTERPAFAAVMEAMSALREAASADTHREARREAHMRQMVRSAIKEGRQNIAVVCGAWHAPVIHPDHATAKADAALLKGLPKVKVSMTWTPWSHRRLCFASGYGAGIEAPGWYLHLWRAARDASATRWLTQAAQRLRAAHVDVSSAHVIEAVRLAETLARLRGREQPDLNELNQAAISVMCDGNAAVWSLVRDELLIAEQLGTLPDSVPIVPLARDIADQQKSLRLPSEPLERETELDLRKPLDLARSSFLHRLRLLDIPWGTVRQAGGEGSFREAWKLCWKPEFAVRFIEANVHGGTLAQAAAHCAIEAAGKAEDLNALVNLLDGALFADLPPVAIALTHRLQAIAARQHDTLALMQALPRLVELLRYGNVRGKPPQELRAVTDEIVTRIAIGYPGACRGLDDEAAEKTWQAARSVHHAVSLIEGVDWPAQWQAALARLPEDAHGWLAGSASRWRYDAGGHESDELSRQISLRLSQAQEPAAAACWMEGFLGDSALPLVLDGRLFEPLDQWISGLADDHFQSVLPLLRRAFSRFPQGERRQLGERVQRGQRTSSPTAEVADFDEKRARRALPTLALLLGCSETELMGAQP